MLLRIALLAVGISGLAFAQEGIASAVEDPYLLTMYIESHRQPDFGALEKALRAGNPEISLPRCDSGECHAELVAVPGTKPEQAIVWAFDSLSENAFWLRYKSDATGAWRIVSARPVMGKYFSCLLYTSRCV